MSQATYAVGRRADLDASIVSFYANEAYAEVASVVAHTALESVTTSAVAAGARRVEMPNDFGELVYATLSNASGTQELKVASAEFVETEFDSTDSSTPQYFVFQGNGIELWPAPESAWSIQLRYRAAPSDLIALTDTPALSAPWRAAILPKLEEKLHNILGNPTGAALAHQRYLSYVQSIPSDEARRQSGQHPRGVRVVY